MKIAFLDDEEKIVELLLREFSKTEHLVTGYTDPRSYLEAIEKGESYDLLFSDIKMPHVDGREILVKTRTLSPKTEVVLFSAYAENQTASDMLELGAYDYILKPFTLMKIRNLVKNVCDKKNLETENNDLRDSKPLIYFPGGKMDHVVSMIEKVSRLDTTVLLTGESGTGKTLIAKKIHDGSLRKFKPFISVNCSLISETLIESELFGYEKGAFTGANSRKIGWIERAEGGTLFFDEIGEIENKIQLKLLRLVQEKKIERVGGSDSIPVNVRMLFATNKNLEKLIEEKKFREDLYYRINVVKIEVPPLRERKNELPLLITNLGKNIAMRIGIGTELEISDEANKLLQAYNWPGNIRELENILERALIVKEQLEVLPQDLPSEISKESDRNENITSDSDPIFKNIVTLFESGMSWDQFEKKVFHTILAHSNNNHTIAAKKVGLTRRIFSYKL